MYYQLIYSSNFSKKTAIDIPAMLRHSKEFNGRNGITGCLIQCGTEFLHFLEGEKEVVTDLYKKISKDQRHQQVNIVYDQESEKRSFSEFYIAVKNLPHMEELEDNVVSCDGLKELRTGSFNGPISIRFFWELASQLCENPVSTRLMGV